MPERYKQQLSHLRGTITKMEFLFNAIDEAVIWTNENGSIQWCNQVFDALIGKPLILLLGKDILELLESIKLYPINRKINHAALFNVPKDGWNDIEYMITEQDKSSFFRISIRHFIQEDGEQSYLIVIRNITEQRIIQKQLEHLASRDPLTNLPNRRQFVIHFEKELSRSQRFKRQFAVLFVDVNQFKMINDTYGHKAGDLYLVKLAKRLIQSVREEDFVARIGGDEFMVIISEIKNKQSAKIAEEKIYKLLNTTYDLHGKKIDGSVSIGSACIPSDGEVIDEIINIADRRMYQAKNAFSKRDNPGLN